MLDLDWADIALHAAGAVVVLANGAFWITREVKQKPDNPWRIFTSAQCFMEWFVPSVAVPFFGYLGAAYFGLIN